MSGSKAFTTSLNPVSNDWQAMKTILVISNNTQLTADIRAAFDPTRHVHGQSNLESALCVLAKKRYDLVFLSMDAVAASSGKNPCMDAIQAIKGYYPTIEIIAVAEREAIRQAVHALKAGASDYVTVPINREEIKLVTKSINEQVMLRSELDYLREKFWHSDFLQIVHTKNSAMREVYDKVRSVAPTRATVLLYGETGTGKGVMASLIHRHSNREEGRFISIHCGAIPDTLLESELFGHEKGAFTGAIKRKLGKFELARCGTIFLDEIATISSSAQIKLLQVLQGGTFSRVGGEDVLSTDARIIAATNVDLGKMSEDGDFRKDLFYRLNVFPIEIPPLRKRPEDIPLLAESFLHRLNRDMQKSIHSLHPEVLAAMQEYPWPGNIRELENLMERAYILETSNALAPSGFPAELFSGRQGVYTTHMATGIGLSEARRRAVEDFERRYLESLLTGYRGKIGSAAKSAGITPRQLNKLMSRYGLRKEAFKD